MKVLSRLMLTVLLFTVCVPISHVMFWHTSTSLWALCCFVWNKTLKVQSSSSIRCVHLVSDIDECSSENECHVNATCTNTMGSYICTCKKGMEGDGRNCSGKLQSNKGTIATADADSLIYYSLDVLGN